jgi:hypothetical protein
VAQAARRGARTAKGKAKEGDAGFSISAKHHQRSQSKRVTESQNRAPYQGGTELGSGRVPYEVPVRDRVEHRC